MSDPHKHDPFARVDGPTQDRRRHRLAREDLEDRTRRIRMLGELARALMAGRMPPPAARVFVGGALLAWLDSGDGDLERDYLRVVQRGSRYTPARVWQQVQGRIGDDDRLDEARQSGASDHESTRIP